MKTDIDSIKRLIVCSLLDELSPSEKELLDAWRRQDTQHEEIYRRIVSGEECFPRLQEMLEVDVALAEEKNRQLLRSREVKKRVVRLIPYAAVVVMALGIWMLVRDGEYRDGEASVVAAGGKQAELVMYNGEIIQLTTATDMELKDNNTNIRIVDNVVSYDAGMSSAEERKVHMLRTPLGGEYAVTLSDGSKVWLNAMSELSFPIAFNGTIREVFLKGEAYFEVAPDKNSPFIVHTEEYDVRVLGTVFNISAYPDDSRLTTTLCSGSVVVDPLNRTLKTYRLQPGEQLNYYRENGNITQERVDTDLYTAWVNGYFRFENNSIEEVFDVLRRWYDIEVNYEKPESRNELFSGKLPRFNDLQIIIDLIEKVSPLKIDVEGKKVIIK